MTRTIVITGATGELGKKTAEVFAALGHSLVLLDRNQDKLDALTGELNLTAERLLTSMVDLRDGEAVRATAEAAAETPAPLILLGVLADRAPAGGESNRGGRRDGAGSVFCRANTTSLRPRQHAPACRHRVRE